MKKKIKLLIQGGLGNQLFCYAAGYSMAKMYNAELILDIFDYQNGYFRPLKLFNLNVNHEKILKRIKLPFNLFYLYKKYILRDKWVKENKPYFFQDITTQLSKNNVYMDGYWQSEKYNLFPDEIRKKFTLKDNNHINNLDSFRNKLKAFCNNTIAVHIRRGDFASGGCAVDISYYENAINLMQSKFSNSIFIFFSDDVNFVKKEFNFDSHKNFILAKDLYNASDDLVELFCIASCEHQIISNSSFAWWAAWLNSNKNKTVIAPQPSYLIGSNYYPESWILLPAEIEETK